MPVITHSSNHIAVIAPESVKQSIAGGVEFVIICCGQYEKSIHIQAAAKFTQDELQRIVEDNCTEVASEHANEQTALEFVKSYASNR